MIRYSKHTEDCMMNKLNPRQTKFIEGIEEGMSLADAYRKAGYKSSDRTVYSNASQLVRNPKVVEELDRRLFSRKRAAEQRLGGMVDGATNCYVKILKLSPGEESKLWELQRKVSADVFDRIGLKPKEQVEHSGEVKVHITFMDIVEENMKRRSEGG